MTDDPLKPDFDWVKARSQCSAYNMFNQLRLDANRNVTSRNQIRQERQEKENVSLNQSGDKFSVVREVQRRSVDFTLKGDVIAVSGDGVSRPFTAMVTLQDVMGHCRLLVNGKELDRWHFLRMALEELFFAE